jgi:hypothetical protein
MSAKNAESEKSSGVSISASVVEEKQQTKSTFAKAENGSTRVTQISLSRDESIMREYGMYNLGCNAGHHWFSPTPEEFTNPPAISCGYPAVPGGCPFPLHLLNEKGELI